MSFPRREIYLRQMFGALLSASDEREGEGDNAVFGSTDDFAQRYGWCKKNLPHLHGRKVFGIVRHDPVQQCRAAAGVSDNKDRGLDLHVPVFRRKDVVEQKTKPHHHLKYWKDKIK